MIIAKVSSRNDVSRRPLAAEPTAHAPALAPECEDVGAVLVGRDGSSTAWSRHARCNVGLDRTLRR
jgi:hypothetical protein